MSFRFRINENVFVVAEIVDGAWRVNVTDVRSEPVAADVRKKALSIVLDELSSLRAHIWHEELGHPRRTGND